MPTMPKAWLWSVGDPKGVRSVYTGVRQCA
jgi:hypothetical protein